MTAKHTPGPWIAVRADIHSESNDRWSVCTEGPRQFVIATIENGAPGDIVSTEEVNARLIAAVPDMLEALEAARITINSALDGGFRELYPEKSERQGAIEQHVTMRKILRVLDKAKAVSA